MNQELTEEEIRAICEGFSSQVNVVAGGSVEHVPFQRKFRSTASRNTILYGPPGTGKTFNTVNLALEILELEPATHDREEATDAFRAAIEDGSIAFVTFHQSYSYEDFVEGIRPQVNEATGSIGYAVNPGIFKTMATRAKLHPTDAFVLIIDEINRGNISGVFGELISLIEESKRLGREEEISTVLPYSRESFGVPDNLFIIGTMNTADRSLTGMDAALRRRFEFRQMPPRYDLFRDADGLAQWQVAGLSIAEILDGLNRRLYELKGNDQLIGHAYFMLFAEPEKRTLESLANVFRVQILPLLHDYFYDDAESIMRSLGQTEATGDPYNYVQRRPALVPELGNIWQFNQSAPMTVEFYRQIVGAPRANLTPLRNDWSAVDENSYERDGANR